MASAYLKTKGSGFENVYQLSGGIQRYLEQFPDGGFYKGKNFVFDHRISVGSSDTDVIGSCLLCGALFDDYSSRHRCHLCRMLVLVCENCQKNGSAIYICELCQKSRKGNVSTCLQEKTTLLTESMPEELQEMKPESATFCGLTKYLPEPSGLCGESLDSIPPRKLRILCLHGFRQNASGFKGRLGSFMKKLKHLAEFVFVDAPHGLPFIVQPRPTQLNGEAAQFPAENGAAASSSSPQAPFQSTASRRYAWLVTKKQENLTSPEWEVANEPFDPSQYQQQTEGWEESYNFLKKTFSQMGPFDGVLGFSQGASMAATLCARRANDVDIDFKFAILCSGFCTPAFGFKGLIECPSLHIFGGTVSKDKQISGDASFKLANLFNPACTVVVEHNSGHIVPTEPAYISQIKNFLQRFQ
ncbi:Rhodanese-like domain-containing protein 6 [Nymphaea thermarum]|nr:Rhodanese-like domain-containing protein 6 [Nymphaea thermarum]